MRTLIVLLALVLVAPAAQGQLNSDVFGGWNWQSTTMNDGSVVTPAIAGYTEQLQFSEDGTFLRYRDYSLVDQSVWGVSYVWVEINGGLVHLEFLTTGVGDNWEPTMIFPAAMLELRNTAGDTEQFFYLGPVSEENATWGALKTLYR